MSPPIICIVGKDKRKKSGLMVALIKEFKARNMKVGAIKYHKHGDFDIDTQGKDSWKYAEAGADTVAISSALKFAVIKKVSSEPDIDDITQKHFADCDIVLADGFTLSNKPRMIIADTVEDIEIFKQGSHVITVIGKMGLRIDDIDAIAGMVIEEIGKDF